MGEGTDVVLLDDVLAAVDKETERWIVEECIGGELLQEKTVILVSNSLSPLLDVPSLDKVIRLEHGHVVNELTAVEAKEKWEETNGRGSGTNSEIKRREEKTTKNRKEIQSVVEANGEETNDDKTVPWSIYLSYFASAGGPIFWFCYFIINTIAHVLMVGQNRVLGKWVDAAAADGGESGRERNIWFGIYAAVQVGSGVFLTIMYLYVIFGGLRASRKFHCRLLNSIFRAPIHWFDITPTGRLINRFSKDMEVIDTEVPESLQPIFDYGSQVIIVAIMIVSILPIFIIPAIVISIAFSLFGLVYVRNALSARKYVAISRSPLFSTLADASTGMIVIRAFKLKTHFMERFMELTDEYNRMQLYEKSLAMWLQVRIDIVAALVSFIVGFLCLRTSMSTGTAGFLISVGIEFTNRVLYVVKAINTNSLAFNSVERVLEYVDGTPQEPAYQEKFEVAASWPEMGDIQVEEFSAGYSKEGEFVLKNLDFHVNGGETIGIVGRTGCGKSSLSLAFLRTLEKTAGKIVIDGRDIGRVNISDLRSRITLISQDPVLFSGTIRSNLDPRGQYDDADLWAALRMSGFMDLKPPESSSDHEVDGSDLSSGASLKRVSASKEPTERENNQRLKASSRGSPHSGSPGYTLDSVVLSEGSNFSLGQRQLLSLARALVRNSKVIILDEATANVDKETDSRMSIAIKGLKEQTVLIIAHRLETVIEADKILVLEEGRLSEFDTPKNLLQRKESLFWKICEQSRELDSLMKRVGCQ